MIQSPEHDLAEWTSASDHGHKLRHSNSGREKFGSAYRQKKKQEVETTYNRALLTPLFALIKILRDI